MPTLSCSSSGSSSPAWPRRFVGAVFLLWLALTLFGPLLPQHPGYHDFADHRHWGALPFAADVLSNLGFLVAGLAGLWMLRATRDARVSFTARCMSALFFVGLVCCFAGSAYYHWAPDDAGLIWDRLAMCLPFAGILGLAVQQTCRDDASAWLAALAMLVMGVAATLVWAQSGNMLSWAVAQGGGMLALVVMAFLPSQAGSLRVSLGAVIGFYVLAKVFELADAQVFEMNCGLLSGHSAKHLIAAAAAWPVLHALGRLHQRERERFATLLPSAAAMPPNKGTMPIRNKLRRGDAEIRRQP